MADESRTSSPRRAVFDEDDLFPESNGGTKYFPMHLGLRNMVFFRKLSSTPSEKNNLKPSPEMTRIVVPKIDNKTRIPIVKDEEVCSLDDSPVRLCKVRGRVAAFVN